MRVPAFAHGYLATPVIDRDLPRRDARHDARCARRRANVAEDRRRSTPWAPAARPTKRCFACSPRAAAALACSSSCGGRSSPPSSTARAYLEKALSELEPQKASPAPAEARGKRRPHLLDRDRAGSGPPRARGIPGDGSLGLEGPPGHGAGSATRPMPHSCAGRSRRWPARLRLRPFAPSRRQAGEHADRGARGRAAFTWKTAYDEEFHDFSPGMLTGLPSRWIECTAAQPCPASAASAPRMKAASVALLASAVPCRPFQPAASMARNSSMALRTASGSVAIEEARAPFSESFRRCCLSFLRCQAGQRLFEIGFAVEIGGELRSQHLFDAQGLLPRAALVAPPVPVGCRSEMIFGSTWLAAMPSSIASSVSSRQSRAILRRCEIAL